jgi:hypothetical protein
MSRTTLSISSIGAIARQALAQAQAATVWGVTSRGIFLHLSSDWVIFLSFEPFRGPLTLNSFLHPHLFQSLKPGLTVNLASNTLQFDNLGIEVDLAGAVLWSPPARADASPVSLAGRRDRLESVFKKVLAERGDTISDAFLSDFTTAPGKDIHITNAAIENSLGLGPGLTPACDDLALGYLLAINRWGDLLCPDLDLAEINRTLRQAAYRKTCTLSANLIECATLAQADERLVLALDGILTGAPDPAACVAHLLSWGHTSGAHALAGMRQAILSPVILSPVILS